jgi:hypothetical protein
MLVAEAIPCDTYKVPPLTIVEIAVARESTPAKVEEASAPFKRVSVPPLMVVLMADA